MHQFSCAGGENETQTDEGQCDWTTCIRPRTATQAVEEEHQDWEGVEC